MSKKKVDYTKFMKKPRSLSLSAPRDKDTGFIDPPVRVETSESETKKPSLRYEEDIPPAEILLTPEQELRMASISSLQKKSENITPMKEDNRVVGVLSPVLLDDKALDSFQVPKHIKNEKNSWAGWRVFSLIKEPFVGAPPLPVLFFPAIILIIIWLT
jgi:hypothetical protein